MLTIKLNVVNFNGIVELQKKQPCGNDAMTCTANTELIRQKL